MYMEGKEFIRGNFNYFFKIDYIEKPGLVVKNRNELKSHSDFSLKTVV